MTAQDAITDEQAPPAATATSQGTWALGLLAVLVAQAAVTGTSLVQGSWFSDDLYNAEVSQHAPLSWAFMSRGFFGHFLPAAQVPLWWAGHMVLHHTTVMVAELLVIMATTAVFALLLRRLLGDRPLLVLGVTLLFALSPLTVPSYLWWAAAFELVPAQLCVALALLWHHSWLQRRRPILLVAVSVCVGLGICFWDLANLLIVWLPALTLATARGGLGRRLMAVLRAWPMWIAVLVPLLAYQYYYQNGNYASPTKPQIGPFVRYLGVGWVQGFVPGLFGGPLRWAFVGFGYFGITDAPLWFQVLTELVLVALVVVTLRRCRSAWGAWLMVLLAVVPALAVVALGRLTMTGTSLGRDYRYLAITAVPAMVAVALAVGAAWPRVEGQVATDRAPAVRRALIPHRPVLRTGVALLCVALVAELFTDADYGRTWSKLQTGTYLATFTADAKRMRAESPTHTVALLDENVGDWILVRDFLGPNTSQLSSIGPIAVTKGIQYDGTVTKLYRVDGKGHIVAAKLINEVRLKSSGGGCTKGGKPQQLKLRTAALLPPMGGYAIVLHLTTQASTEVYVRLRASGKLVPFVRYDTATVPVPTGKHTVVFSEEGDPFDLVELVIQSKSPVCLTSAEAAQLGPY